MKECFHNQKPIVLIVGGTFDTTSTGRSSGLIRKLSSAIRDNLSDTYEVIEHNGGNYEELSGIMSSEVPKADFVFWFANVDNTLPKIRNVKEINPKTILVTSKRNDDNKYSIAELINRALSSKSNLLFEFSRQSDGMFNIRVIDPLGCLWYDGADVIDAVVSSINRLMFLRSITRQSSIHDDNANNPLVQMYFDGKLSSAPSEHEFINIVHRHANTFHTLVPHVPTERMLGNCSFVPDKYRCTKGFPSARVGNIVLVSKRNVNKETLSLNDFVPTTLSKDGKLYYYGDNKPSVDTPIQVRLYNALPNINRMIHSHCYIKGAPFTNTCVPCGGLEEVDEVLSVIDETSNRYQNHYEINLIGHGSIVMSRDVDGLKDVKYYARPIPEVCDDKF